MTTPNPPESATEAQGRALSDEQILDFWMQAGRATGKTQSTIAFRLWVGRAILAATPTDAARALQRAEARYAEQNDYLNAAWAALPEWAREAGIKADTEAAGHPLPLAIAALAAQAPAPQDAQALRHKLGEIFDHAVRHALYAEDAARWMTGSHKAKTHRAEAKAAREALLDAALTQSAPQASPAPMSPQEQRAAGESLYAIWDASRAQSAPQAKALSTIEKADLWDKHFGRDEWPPLFHKRFAFMRELLAAPLQAEPDYARLSSDRAKVVDVAAIDSALQAEPEASGNAESDTVQLFGVRSDGTEVLVGTARTPPKMKAREIVRQMFGEIDEEAGDAGAMALWCCEQLIDWLGVPVIAEASGNAESAPIALMDRALRRMVMSVATEADMKSWEPGEIIEARAARKMALEAIDAHLEWANARATTATPAAREAESGELGDTVREGKAMTLRLPQELYEALKQVADIDRVPVIEVVRRAIDNKVSMWKAAYEEEARKFQAETLRTSQLHAALTRTSNATPQATLICPRCKVDRFKADCPQRIGCPMTGVSQTQPHAKGEGA